MQQTGILIEMQYAGCIAWYREVLQAPAVRIERWEHYVKRSYRNRCCLAGPNGPLRLTVPLERGKNQHTVIRDVRIAYGSDWQKIHWQSLCSVYRSSPYFEYFEDELAPIIHKKHSFLFDLDEELLQATLRWMKVSPPLSYTDKYEKIPGHGILDLRGHFTPGKLPEINVRYRQVFEDRTGFLPNMSILDLLFNVGPGAKSLLCPAT